MTRNDILSSFEDRQKRFRKAGTVTSSEFVTGNQLNYSDRSFMFDWNSNPEIFSSEKYWSLVKVMKSQTWAVHWLIKINGQHFLAVHHLQRLVGHQVSFYKCDNKGKGANWSDPVFALNSFMELEQASDIFANWYMFTKWQVGELPVELPIESHM